MSNGFLKQDNAGNWFGKIETMQHDIAFTLKFTPSDNENAPCFDIMTKSRSGTAVKIGSVWEKKAKDTGQSFYSMTVDDPSLDKPLYVTAFPSRDKTDQFDIIWNRPRPKVA